LPKISRRSRVEQVQVPKYYVHYDASTNQILSVNNYRHADYTDAIEISFEEYDRLVTGRDKFSDFQVGVVVQPDGSSAGGLVTTRVAQEHSFKNRFLIWIDKKCESPDINIHWDQYNRHWLFFVSGDLRTQYYSNKLPVSTISFFVTMGRDPNFLLRSMEIDLEKLVEGQIIIKFETEWESDIDKISLTSSLASLQYSLTIWKLNEQDTSN